MAIDDWVIFSGRLQRKFYEFCPFEFHFCMLDTNYYKECSTENILDRLHLHMCYNVGSVHNGTQCRDYHLDEPVHNVPLVTYSWRELERVIPIEHGPLKIGIRCFFFANTALRYFSKA